MVVLVDLDRNPNYRAYRRGRENEPGGIGTVTIGFPSVGMGSSLPEARTSLKGSRSAVQRKKRESSGLGSRSGVESVDIRSARVLSRRFSCSAALDKSLGEHVPRHTTNG